MKVTYTAAGTPGIVEEYEVHQESEMQREIGRPVAEFDAYLTGRLDREDPAIERFAIRFCIRQKGKGSGS